MSEVRIDVTLDQHNAPAELGKTKTALADVESQAGKTSLATDTTSASFGNLGDRAKAFGQLLERYGIQDVAQVSDSIRQLKSDQGKLEVSYKSGVISLDQYQKACEKINSSLQTLQGRHEEATKQSDSFSSVFKRQVEAFATGQVAANALMGAFHKLTSEMKSTIDAADEQEKVDRALASALELTGAKIPLPSLKEFDSELQRETLYSDEAIEKGQALLVQMVKLDEAGLKKATKGAIGLASVFGMDLQSAFMLVEKSLNGNSAALSRYGIRVDEALSTEQKQKEMMDQLSAMYGRAQDETLTHAGRVAQMKNAYGDFKEQLGDVIIRGTGMNTWLPVVTKLFDKMNTSLETSIGNLDKLTGEQIYAQLQSNLFSKDLQNLGGTTSVWDAAVTELNNSLGHFVTNADGTRAILVTMPATVDGLTDAFNEGPDALKKYVDGLRQANTVAVRNIELTDGLTDSQRNLIKEYGGTWAPDLVSKIKAVKDALEAYKKTGAGSVTGLRAMETGLQSLEDALTGETQAFRDANKQVTDFGKGASASGWADLAEKMNSTTSAVAKMNLASDKGNTAMAGLSSGASKAGTAMSGFEKVMAQFKTKAELETELGDDEKALDAMTKSGKYTAAEIDDLRKKILEEKKALGDTTGWEKQKKAMDSFASYAQVVSQGLNTIFSSLESGRSTSLENWYTSQKEILENSITDEDELQEKLADLEEEYEKKQREVKRKAAKEQKVLNMFEIVTNTASAIAEALPNLALAALVGGMGAAELAVVAAEPLPLAKGAAFKGPTILPGINGQTYQVAEAGETEIVAPESVIRKAVRDELKAAGSKKTINQTFNYSSTVNTSREIDEKYLVKILQSAVRKGMLKGYN